LIAKNFDFHIEPQLSSDDGFRISNEEVMLFADLVQFVGMLERHDQSMTYVAKFADVVSLRLKTRRFIYERAKDSTEIRDG